MMRIMPSPMMPGNHAWSGWRLTHSGYRDSYGAHLLETEMSTTSDAPWAADAPPWSGPRPGVVERAGGKYGTLIATRGAQGSWVLHHDPAETMHVMTLYAAAGQPETVEAYGRLFVVEYRA